MRTSLLSLVLAAAASFLTSCASTSRCTSCQSAQSVVDRVAQQNPECTRLTVHCAWERGATCCASTAAARVGKPSDPEDLEAMKTGKTVVLEEAGAVDVTVPILAKGEKHTAACGVTLKSAGASREQLVGKANGIAKSVEEGLKGCCDCSCK